MLIEEAPGMLQRIALPLAVVDGSPLAIGVVGLLGICDHGVIPYRWVRGQERRPRHAADIIVDLVLEHAKDVVASSHGPGRGKEYLLALQALLFDEEVRRTGKTPTCWSGRTPS